MKQEEIKKNKQKEAQTIVRKCHCCGEISESRKELERCTGCRKPFLPGRYFEKIHHSKSPKDYQKLFADASEVDEIDLIKGLLVIW